MNKRTLNAVGWTLLIAGFLFAFGGIPGIATGGLAITIAFVCGLAAIPLFWFVDTTAVVARDS